jgi:hypothetical protein
MDAEPRLSSGTTTRTGTRSTRLTSESWPGYRAAIERIRDDLSIPSERPGPCVWLETRAQGATQPKLTRW